MIESKQLDEQHSSLTVAKPDELHLGVWLAAVVEIPENTCRSHLTVHYHATRTCRQQKVLEIKCRPKTPGNFRPRAPSLMQMQKWLSQ